MGNVTTPDQMARMVQASYALAASRGMCCAGDLDLIADILTDLGEGKRVTQLGAGSGTMALSILGHPSKPELTTVDNNQENLDWELKALENVNFQDVVFHRYRPLLADSSTLGRAMQDPTPFTPMLFSDLLIVDADHSLKGVLKDLLAWLPRLSRTGWVICHDYDGSTAPVQYPGVKVACDIVLGAPQRQRGWSGAWRVQASERLLQFQIDMGKTYHGK